MSLPPLQGVVSLRVQVMGSTTYTNSISFTYPLPSVETVYPTSFPTAGGTVLKIYGTNIGVDLQATYSLWLHLHTSTLVLQPFNVSRPNQVMLVYNSLSLECTNARVRADVASRHGHWLRVVRCNFCMRLHKHCEVSVVSKLPSGQIVWGTRWLRYWICAPSACSGIETRTSTSSA